MNNIYRAFCLLILQILGLTFYLSCTSPKNDPSALPLEEKAKFFYKKGDIENAFHYYLMLNDSLRTNNSSLLGEKSLTAGKLFLKHARYKLIDSLFRQNGFIQIKDTSSLVEVLRLIGERYLQTDQPLLAEEFFNHALEIRETGFYGNKLLLCQSLTDMANVYLAANNFPLSKEYLDNCKEVLDKITSKGEANAEYSLVLGNYYYRLGNFKKALQAYHNALPLFDSLNNYESKAKALNNSGNACLRLFDIEKALKFFNEALELRIKYFGANHPQTADTQNNLGLVYDYTGEPERAVDYYSKALVIREKFFGNESRIVGKTLTNMANALKDFDNYAEAESLYIQTINIFEKINVDDPDIAITAINLGEVLAVQKKYNDAVKYLSRAVELLVNSYGKDHLWVAAARLNLSISLRSAGKIKEADYQLSTALKIAKSTAGEPSPLTAQVYSEYGYSELEKNNYRKSLFYYQKAIINYIPGFSNSNFLINPDSTMLVTDIRLVKALSAKANLLLKLNNENDITAYNTIKLAEYIVDNIRMGFKEESSGLLLGKEIRSTFEEAVKLCHILYERTSNLKYVDHAFRIFEKSKSVTLLNKVVDNRAKDAAGIPDSLLERERRLRTTISSLQADAMEGLLSADEKIKLFDMKQQYFQLIQIYEDRFPVYYKLKYDPGIINIKELKEGLLKKDETYIQYYLGEKDIFSILITIDTIRFNHLENNNLFNEAALYRTGILESNYRTFTSASYNLYRILIAPLKKSFKGEVLIIVPDAILNNISFETLIDAVPEGDRADYKKLNYLIYKYRISYAYSCSLLKENMAFSSISEMNSTLGFAPY